MNIMQFSSQSSKTHKILPTMYILWVMANSINFLILDLQLLNSFV